MKNKKQDKFEFEHDKQLSKKRKNKLHQNFWWALHNQIISGKIENICK